jgi:hypothetical protein
MSQKSTTPAETQPYPHLGPDGVVVHEPPKPKSVFGRAGVVVAVPVPDYTAPSK